MTFSLALPWWLLKLPNKNCETSARISLKTCKDFRISLKYHCNIQVISAWFSCYCSNCSTTDKSTLQVLGPQKWSYTWSSWQANSNFQVALNCFVRQIYTNNESLIVLIMGEIKQKCDTLFAWKGSFSDEYCQLYLSKKNSQNSWPKYTSLECGGFD